MIGLKKNPSNELLKELLNYSLRMHTAKGANSTEGLNIMQIVTQTGKISEASLIPNIIHVPSIFVNLSNYLYNIALYYEERNRILAR